MAQDWTPEDYRPTNAIPLRPCPFCGGRAEMQSVPEFGDYGQPTFLVSCVNPECAAYLPFGYFEAEIAMAWNRREADVTIDRLAAALTDLLERAEVLEESAQELDPDGFAPGLLDNARTALAETSNAELIVRAVNCHDDLLAACEFALEVLGRQTRYYRDDPILARLADDIAQAVAEATNGKDT